MVEVLPFDRKQVQKFVENWYLANEIMSAQKDDPGVRMKAQEGAEDLLQRLAGAPALSDLTVNPLLLTMIATVHWYKRNLPIRRVELYKEICEVFLGKWGQAKGLKLDLTPAQRQRVLQPLAWHLMETERRELPLTKALAVIAGPTGPLARVSPQKDGEDFLKEMEASTGLVLELEKGVYGFAHLTFQEYLASVHAIENNLSEVLISHIRESWWHETIRLYASQTDATPILQACLQDDPPAIAALTLALEVEAEAREKIAQAMRKRLQRMLEEGADSNDAERRRVVAEALLARRLQHLVRVNEDTFVDPDLITHAEYQLFLDEKRAKGEYLQPDHWQSHRFPPKEGLEPVLGVRSTDAVAFCQWLSERTGGLWRYRLPRANETPWPGKWGENVTWWIEMDGGLELAGRHKWGLDLSLTLDIDFSNSLNLTFAFARTLARTILFGLERAIGLDFAHSLALAHVRSLPFDLASALARTHDLAFDNNLTLDLARTLTHILVLSLDRPRDLDRARDLDLDLDLDRACDLARTLDLGRARDLDLDLYLVRHRARDLAFDRALDHNLYRYLYPDFDLGPYIAPILALDHALDRARALRRSRKGFLYLSRYLLLLFAAILTDAIENSKSVFDFWNSSKEDQLSRWLQSRDDLLDAYLDMVILEERMKGRLPAVEGIRIVRERIKD